jgi:hypothetical protein
MEVTLTESRIERVKDPYEVDTLTNLMALSAGLVSVMDSDGILTMHNHPGVIASVQFTGEIEKSQMDSIVLATAQKLSAADVVYYAQRPSGLFTEISDLKIAYGGRAPEGPVPSDLLIVVGSLTPDSYDLLTGAKSIVYLPSKQESNGEDLRAIETRMRVELTSTSILDRDHEQIVDKSTVELVESINSDGRIVAAVRKSD